MNALTKNIIILNKFKDSLRYTPTNEAKLDTFSRAIIKIRIFYIKSTTDQLSFKGRRSRFHVSGNINQ